MTSMLLTYPMLAAYAPPLERMEPLSVRAELTSTLAVTRPEDIALDGILQRALLEALLGDEFYYLPDAKEHPLFVRLPLALQGPDAARLADVPSGSWLDIRQELQGVWWWYACSTVRLEGIAGRNTHYWNKRFDTGALSDHIDFRGRVEKVIIENGPYKAYHQPLPNVTCRAMSWAVIGNGEEIERLLSTITYVGKKHAYGYGEVRQWKVESATQDESMWQADGRQARPLPVPALLALDMLDLSGEYWSQPPNIAFLAYRAPQWAAYNQAFCAVGGKRR